MLDGLTLFFAIGLLALFAGFVHSAIGFGFGIVAVSLLPWLMDVRQAHVVISTASVPVLVMATWAYRKGAEPGALLRSLFAAAVALPVGLVAFHHVSIDWLVRGTGLAILGMIYLNRRNRSGNPDGDDGEPSNWFRSPYVAGAVGGFLAGSVSIAGPPIAAFALGMPWTQERFKAFVNQFLLAVSIYKVAGLGVGGYLNAEVLRQSATLAPTAVVGIWLGAVASRRIPAKRFEGIVMSALIAIAVYFVFAGR